MTHLGALAVFIDFEAFVRRIANRRPPPDTRAKPNLRR